MSYSATEKGVIFLDGFVGMEYALKAKILEAVGSPSEIIENLPKFCKTITNIAGESVYNNMNAALKAGVLESALASLDKKGITAVTVYSEEYPEELKNTACPPQVLYCKGNIKLLKAKDKIGIVGSRKTRPLYREATEDISRELAGGGAVIVTGLAEGGDTAAVEGALESGNVISVLAFGMDFVYPEVNRSLLKKVEEKGLVITEHPPEVSPLPYHFPVRNRIIAGLSKGVLIVSGGEKSGTYYTAEYANEYGKQVFALPYAINDGAGVICNRLIKDGAQMVESAKDMADSLNITLTEKCEKIFLTENEKNILAVLEDEMHTDDILVKSGLKIFQLTPVIKALEIKKLIIKTGSNTYKSK